MHLSNETIALVALAARVALALILLPSALGKLRDIGGFVAGVVNYRILPTSVAQVFGFALPFVELILGIALLLGLALSVSSVLTMALLASFIVAVVVNLQRGRRIACACAGVGRGRTIGWGLVVRNLVLVSMPLLVAAAPYLSLTALAEPFELLGVILLSCAMLASLSLLEWTIETWQRVAALRQAGR